MEIKDKIGDLVRSDSFIRGVFGIMIGTAIILLLSAIIGLGAISPYLCFLALRYIGASTFLAVVISIFEGLFFVSIIVRFILREE